MSHNTSRRTFIKGAAVASSAMLIARFSHAQGPVVAADDPTATALGYVADHTAVDTAKWAKKAGPGGAGQQCTSCAIYQAIDDEYGACPIFAGKRVHANGWCNSWLHK